MELWLRAHHAVGESLRKYPVHDTSTHRRRHRLVRGRARRHKARHRAVARALEVDGRVVGRNRQGIHWLHPTGRVPRPQHEKRMKE